MAGYFSKFQLLRGSPPNERGGRSQSVALEKRSRSACRNFVLRGRMSPSAGPLALRSRK